MTDRERALIDYLRKRVNPSVRRVILSPAALNALTLEGVTLTVPVLEELGASSESQHLTVTLVHVDGTLTSKDFE
jgi:hypothetical protein